MLQKERTVRFRRRWFRPGDTIADPYFQLFVPLQYKSWRQWSIATKQGHQDAPLELAELPDGRFIDVLRNADLLLALLSNLGREDFLALANSDPQTAPLTDEFRNYIMSRHHSWWLTRRVWDPPTGSLLQHKNHRLWESMSDSERREHGLFADQHAALLKDLKQLQPRTFYWLCGLTVSVEDPLPLLTFQL